MELVPDGKHHLLATERDSSENGAVLAMRRSIATYKLFNVWNKHLRG
jgi:hypothetical protein